VSRRLLLPSIFFFLSGACALVYQVVWVRQLLLLAGSTTAAVSTVLSVFMAGLGLGAWIFGGRADRVRSPLALYAYLEMGIGLYALVLPDLLGAVTPAYVEMARSLSERPVALTVLRVALGFALLLPPAVLMGGTLPALVRYVSRAWDRFGADLGFLYAANLAGGVAGSLAAGFVLIRTLGVQGATMAAVVGNLTVGLAALLWASRALPPAAEGEAPLDTPPPGPGLSHAARRLVWVAVVFSGLLTMAYEVLWTRVLVFALWSTVYSFTLILAAFLLGLALGSRLSAAAPRGVHALPLLAGASILAGVSALAFTPLATVLVEPIEAVCARLGYSGTVYLASTAAGAAAVILVPATFMGVVLPLGMRLLVDDLQRAGRRVGAAYLANSAGSVAGSLLAGFALIPLAGLKGALLWLAVFQGALGWALLGHADLDGRRRFRLRLASALALVAALAAAGTLLRGANPFDRPPTFPGGPAPVVVAHRDAVGASITVVGYGAEGRSLRIDGFEAARNGAEWAGYMPMMTHIPMLLHPDPRRLLVICFGTGSTAGAGLLHPEVTVDVVDINRAVIDMAGHFESWNHGVAHNPRTRLIIDDGRNYVLTTRSRYDVITSEPMPPRFAGVVNLYSREYYQLARERLNPGGFLAQWLPMHLVSLEESLGILRTVREVFPETTLWLHHGTGIIVARRDEPIRLDVARIAHALDIGPLRADLARFGAGTPMGFARLYALGPVAVAAVTARTPPITDDRPSLEFHAPRARSEDMRPLPGRRLHVTFEQARAAEVIHRLRVTEAAPLVNASAEAAAELARWRRVDAHTWLAEIYTQWDLPAPAEAELAAARAVEAELRAPSRP
jgi:spermidine synthase